MILKRMVCYAFLVAVTCITLIDSAKILMLCGAAHSRIAGYLAISDELIKTYGHQISMVLPPDFPEKSITDKGVNILRYRADQEVIRKIVEAENSATDAAVRNQNFYDGLRYWSEIFTHASDAMLSDETFIAEVKKQKFDLMLVEAFMLLRGNVILPHKVGVPFIAESIFFEPWLTGVPALPSVQPHHATMFTPDMTFLERITNCFVHVMYNLTPFPYGGSWLLEKHLPNVKKSFRELASEAEFWLFPLLDPHMDFIVPSTPNMAFVGGLTTVPAKPLPKDIEEFMHNAEYGVIVLSFGSTANLIPEFIFEKFFNAFDRIKQKVLVRTPNNYTGDIPKNVMALNWLPQNDALGHPKTKLFITHCGNAGQYEALYHAVPMLGVPFMPSDQQHNSKRIEYKGFGISIDFRTATSNQIYETIQKILNDPSYVENIKKASDGFKSAPLKPAERGAYWIDYIAKYGGDNLRPHTMKMPLWEYLMLDIAAILIVLSTVLLIFFLVACRFVCLKLRGPSKVPLGKSKKSN